MKLDTVSYYDFEHVPQNPLGHFKCFLYVSLKVMWILERDSRCSGKPMMDVQKTFSDIFIVLSFIFGKLNILELL